MKIKTIVMAMMLCLLCLATSCKSKEESVIDGLNQLAEWIEDNGNDFDKQDWENVLSDWQSLQEEMQDCQFTTEEMKEVGKAQGRVCVALTKQGSRYVSGALQGLDSFTQGFQEAFQENIDEEELEDIQETISNALNAF